MPHSRQKMLIDFFDPDVKGEDEQGRTLETILAWDDNTLENTHDYIQTLFPLPEESVDGDNAPLVTPEVRQVFLQRQSLRENLISAYYRMLSFFGLHYEVLQDIEDNVNWMPPGGDVNWCVTQGPNWDTACDRWVVPDDSHNHERITRIIRSLRVLGCKEQAFAFHSFLVEDEEVLEIVP